MGAEGVGLAMSGGGYRATLFHLGSLWRLNELGWLPRIDEICSVSGGSITAGALATAWGRLDFDERGVAANFAAEVARPLSSLCGRTLDVPTILGGLLPFRTASDLLAARYDRHLFGGRTLQDLPAEGPLFTFYATSLQTGASVRFSRPYLGEYHLGRVLRPAIPLARVVAASSAFPPFYVPVTLDLPPEAWQDEPGADLHASRALRSRLLLGDGGIYDNLGLERIWNRRATLLVSDAGAPFATRARSLALRFSLLARILRVLDITTEQTRALRRRRVVADFVAGRRRGAYWGIATEIGGYDLAARGRAPALVADGPLTRAQARLRTRLNRFSPVEQGRLVNWGYALTDAALRCYVLEQDPPPGRWPFPEQPL